MKTTIYFVIKNHKGIEQPAVNDVQYFMGYSEACLSLLEEGYDLVSGLDAANRAMFRRAAGALYPVQHAFIGSVDAAGRCPVCESAEIATL